LTEFTLAPPLEGAWSTLASEPSDLLAERLRDFDALPREIKVGAIRVLKLPFYSDIFLCDAQVLDGDAPGAMLSFLYGRDGVRLLNGESEIIHRFNSQNPPDLADLLHQEAYLRFFCAFVHGGDGPFEVLLNLDQIVLDQPLTHPVMPPVFVEETGLWVTTILYGTALFEADFRLSLKGNVNMTRDSLIREGVQRRPQIGYDGAARHKKGTRHDI
jgi:hypothetical protein